MKLPLVTGETVMVRIPALEGLHQFTEREDWNEAGKGDLR